MEESRPAEIWTPGKLLRTWGLRVVGSALTHPNVASRGGDVTSDDEWQAVRYVEETAGFARAKPALRFVHVEFRDLDSDEFRLVLPGETTLIAINRLDWMKYVHYPTQIETVRQLAKRAYNEFLDTLIARWKDDPFMPLREEEKPDANEIGERAGDELNAWIDRQRREGRV